MLTLFGVIFILLITVHFGRSLFIKDELRSLRINYYARILAVAVFLVAGLHYATRYYDEMTEQAFQAELRAEIKRAQDSQEVYFKEYLRYAKTAEALAYTPDNRYSFFFSEVDFPIYLKHNLEQKDWAYATNADYQIVIEVLRRTGVDPEILIQPRNGPLRGQNKK